VIQAAMITALGDDHHVRRRRCTARWRDRLKPAPRGRRLPHRRAAKAASTSGPLRGDAWAAVDRLAGLGILVVPGTFYGSATSQRGLFSRPPDAAIDFQSGRAVAAVGPSRQIWKDYLQR
jgi:hypothetical protein